MPDSSSKIMPTPAQWDQLRFRFMDSIMLQTELVKLAQNIDVTWPIRGKDETPLKYVHYSMEELLDLPEFFGKTDRLPLLVKVLAETLAFDDPFGEMIDYFEANAQKEDLTLKSLHKLEIPLNLPLRLANFSAETAAFCIAEEISDLGQLVEISRRMAQNVIVGGEFRQFLNALAHLDPRSLKRFLPIREGHSGLFLAESLGHLAGRCSASEAASVLSAYGIAVSKPAWANAKILPSEAFNQWVNSLKPLICERFDYLPDQTQQLRHACQSDPAAVLRFFAPLQDPHTEALAHAIACVGLDLQTPSKNLFKRLFSR